MKRTVEDGVTIGDLLCILRDMGIAQKFCIIGKAVTTKPMTAEELLDELTVLGEVVLWYQVTAIDRVGGKTYITIE